MPTGTADPADRRRVRSALLLPVLLTSLLTACGDDSPAAPSDPDAGVAEAIQRTLRQRARAIVGRDPVAFERTLGQRDRDFLAEQDGYYENLDQLPLGTVRFDLEEQTLEPDGDGYWAEVTVRLQLQDYDVAPSSPTTVGGSLPPATSVATCSTSTTDAAWEADSGSDPQPWDLGEIEVRDGAGVLGIFDSTTVRERTRSSRPSRRRGSRCGPCCRRTSRTPAAWSSTSSPIRPSSSRSTDCRSPTRTCSTG